ncbi:MAG TPA: flavodoxin domain-containing protein, partial [Archangium sp.]
MTALRPGASPPPVLMAMRLIELMSCEVYVGLGAKARILSRRSCRRAGLTTRSFSVVSSRRRPCITPLTMRVLVAYGSKRGGPEGLARAVAEGLTEAGHAVDVRSAGDLETLDRWDAVIIGGALYAWHWHRNARRFVKQHVEELQQRPVWFFSSGPLDHSASQHELPPPRSIERLMHLTGAKAHKTFGGRLLPDDDSA